MVEFACSIARFARAVTCSTHYDAAVHLNIQVNKIRSTTLILYKLNTCKILLITKVLSWEKTWKSLGDKSPASIFQTRCKRNYQILLLKGGSKQRGSSFQMASKGRNLAIYIVQMNFKYVFSKIKVVSHNILLHKTAFLKKKSFLALSLHPENGQRQTVSFLPYIISCCHQPNIQEYHRWNSCMQSGKNMPSLADYRRCGQEGVQECPWSWEEKRIRQETWLRLPLE